MCGVTCAVTCVVLHVWCYMCGYMCGVTCVVLHVWCYMCGVTCVVTCVVLHVWCYMCGYMCGVTCVVLHVWCYMCGVTCVVLHVWCYMCGVTCVVLHVWCYMCGVTCVTCVVLHVWCYMCGVTCVTCVVLHVWCYMCGVTCVVLTLLQCSIHMLMVGMLCDFQAAALLHVVIMDVFAEVLRGSADSDDGSLFESSTTLALSDDEGSLADTLPSANPLLDITPGKRIPEAIIPSDNHNSNDDTNPLVESHSTQSITSNVARTKSVERNTSALPTNGVSGESLFQTSSESDTSSLAPTVSPLQDTASAQQSPNKTISSESESEESEKSSEPTANFYNRFLASTHTMSLRSDVSDRSDAPEEDDLFLTLSSGPSALSRKRASLSPNPASALSSSRRASVLSDTFAMYGVKESDSDTDSS